MSQSQGSQGQQGGAEVKVATTNAPNVGSVRVVGDLWRFVLSLPADFGSATRGAMAIINGVELVWRFKDDKGNTRDVAPSKCVVKASEGVIECSFDWDADISSVGADVLLALKLRDINGRIVRVYCPLVSVSPPSGAFVVVSGVRYEWVTSVRGSQGIVVQGGAQEKSQSAGGGEQQQSGSAS